MRQWLFWTFIFLLIGSLFCGAIRLTGEREHPPLRAQVQVTDILREGPTLGFAVADRPRAFEFPRDHGPHPEFRSEWWYFTGNLVAADGRRFGYQLTVFRSALKPPLAQMLQEQGPSAWHADQLYMAQFAVTDATGRRFVCSDRFARAAVGLAGAQANPFHVWLDGWSITAVSNAAAGPGLLPPLRLQAAQPSEFGEVQLDLNLVSQKPPVLHGDQGFSRKSAGPGQASYYYSLTNLTATGTLQIGAERFQLTGLSWMDREWSTSSLGADQVGWDWFALHLNDGRELMYYQLRRKNGQVDPHSAGALIAADGSVTRLTPADVQLQVAATWHSDRTGADYPARWRLYIPTQKIDLTILPLLPDQELNLYVQYWEGACRVLDTTQADLSTAVPSGYAYVELTGYATPPAPTAP